jgi:hypothetical protein
MRSQLHHPSFAAAMSDSRSDHDEPSQPKEAIPAGLLLTLADALKLLPHIRPRLARKTLDDFRAALADQLSPSSLGGEDREAEDCRVEAAPGLMVTWAEMNAINHGSTPPLVTPEGAAFLIRLYETGVFELKPKRERLADPTELRAYAASRPALEALAAVRRDAEAVAAAERQAWIANPAQIPVAAFTYRLLSDVFFHHGVATLGVTQMEVGGITVTREATPHASNSGRSRDWHVSFTYRDTDDVDIVLEKESRYASNRRNDPGRNWGLGPE